MIALLLAAFLAPVPPAQGFVVRRGPALEVACAPALADQAETLAQKAEAAFAEAARRLGLAPADAGGRALLIVFSSHEEKALATDSITDVSLLPDGAAACVHDPPVARLDGRAAAALALARAFRGVDPDHPLLLGARSALADRAERERCGALAAWIENAGETTPLADLLDPRRCSRRSFLLQVPLLAQVAALLLDEGGAPALGSALRGEVGDPDGLARRFRSRLARLVRRHGAYLEERRRRRARLARLVDLRGACFAHEGYRIVDGYASRMARRSLERLRDLGAEAVSITPFAFYRDPHAPHLSWNRRTLPGRSGGETVEAVRHAALRAHELGLRVVLKPHVWGHGWSGDIEMTSERDWRLFFDEYGEFLVHQALLAETVDADWLSIGCEMVRATKGHDAQWRRLAERARRLFSGGITYAANWGEEMERLGFADALDAVGVDAYQSLSDSDAPSDEELVLGARRELERIAALERRYGRPVFLTEVGFPDRRAAWRDPHRGGGGPRSPIDQARALRAFAVAFEHQTTPRVRGFFLWKWPTLEHWDGRRRTDFWPASKAALEAVRLAFAR